VTHTAQEFKSPRSRVQDRAHKRPYIGDREPARQRRRWSIPAEGTVRMVARRSLVSEYSAPSARWKDHVEALSHALATFGEFARQGMVSANTRNDADTADIFTEISGVWTNGCGWSRRT
jgi:hypothetical protein